MNRAESGVCLDALQLHRVKQNRLFVEQEQHEHHGSDEQDEELHRNLRHRVKQQAEAALRDRLAGQIPLHLRLIASEIREGEKRASNQSAPKVVTVIRIEVKIHCAELSRCAGQRDRIADTDMGRHQSERDDECQDQREENHRHLLNVGPRNSLDAAGGRVEHHQAAHHDRRPLVRPAKDGGQNDRRRIERDPGRQSALNEEYETHQRARLRVETFLQIFVSGVDVRAVKNGHGRGRENHHRDGQSKIELHKAHAVDISLASGGDESDGAGLSGHDGEPHGVPGHRSPGQQIVFDRAALPAAPQAVRDNRAEPKKHGHPVEWSHGAVTIENTYIAEISSAR